MHPRDPGRSFGGRLGLASVRRRALGPTLSCLLLAVAAAAHATEPTVTPGFTPGGRLGAEGGFRLKLSRPLAAGEGRLVVFVGVEDWTAVVSVNHEVVQTSPSAPRLPLGPLEIVLYRAPSAGRWVELGRFSVEVRSGRPWEKADFKPALSGALNALLREGHRPLEAVPERSHFEDADGKLGFESEHVRRGFRLASQVQVLGVSHHPAALRFGTLGQHAPRIDLGAYSLEVRGGPLATRVGDLSLGAHPQLLSAFSARGASLRVGVGQRADVTVAASSGSQIVGWDNPLGLDTPQHRLLSANLGVELDPARPGGLRLELSALQASLLPIASYTQGVVNDAQESRGYGLRLAGSDRSGRLRGDAGYARSRYANPADPLLAQGTPVVAVREEDRDAYYAQASLDAIRGLRLTDGKTLALTLSGRQERVAPLYRSAGMPGLAADRLQRSLAAKLSVADMTLQLSQQRNEDNLDHVPSILTTTTRQTDLAVNLPTASLVSRQANFWTPVLTYGLVRVHQRGDGVPENGDFSESHVPDQLSTSHVGSVQWQGQHFSLGYSLNHSFQDNRQPGRETADLGNTTHGVTANLNTGEAFELGLELARERSLALETGERTGLRRVAATLGWRLPGGFRLQALASRGWNDPVAERSGAQSLQADATASWSRTLRGPKKPPLLKLYVRGSIRSTRPPRAPAEVGEDPSSWQLYTGVSLNAFAE